MSKNISRNVGYQKHNEEKAIEILDNVPKNFRDKQWYAVKRQLLENSIRKHSLAKRDILANEYTKELKKLDDVVEQKYMIVSKIKFKDLEHVLTILSSETSEIPVFCTKTFLSLKKSLEDVKLVDRLWIEHDRARGKIELSYDATKEQYVGIKVLSNIRFTSEDLGLAEEIYNLYEQGSIGKVKENNQKCVM